MSVKRKKVKKTAEEDSQALFLTDLSLTEEEKELLQCSPCKSKTCSSTSLEVNYDKESVISNLSSTPSTSDGSTKDLTCTASTNSSRYRVKHGARMRPSNLNNFLDFISMCFWKCSTGCQQLPDKH